MKSITLATVAAIALCTPAVAAGQDHSRMTESNRTQSQQQWTQQNVQRIAPSDLDQSQIRQIQQALNKHGFDAGNVDGVWGPETSDAVRNFQEKRNLSTDEALNRETLSALGVDFASNMGGDGAGTTGSATRDTTGSGIGTTGSGAEGKTTGSNVEASDMDGNPATGPSDIRQ
jgi:peptidoglycan hydrolase-like protein with peptidoglycan-binding domain